MRRVSARTRWPRHDQRSILRRHDQQRLRPRLHLRRRFHQVGTPLARRHRRFLSRTSDGRPAVISRTPSRTRPIPCASSKQDIPKSAGRGRGGRRRRLGRRRGVRPRRRSHGETRPAQPARAAPVDRRDAPGRPAVVRRPPSALRAGGAGRRRQRVHAGADAVPVGQFPRHGRAGDRRQPQDHGHLLRRHLQPRAHRSQRQQGRDARPERVRASDARGERRVRRIDRPGQHPPGRRSGPARTCRRTSCR